MNIFARLWKSGKDIYANKTVLLALIKRNTAGRYKNTYVGFIWHLLLPVLMIVVMDITFSYIRPRAMESFWIYLSAGVFPVSFMSSCLRGRAIVANSKYITKMKIPREIVVLAAVASEFFTVIFAYMFIIIAILLAGQPVNWFGVAMIPVGLMLMCIFGLGCAYLISTITVFVPDVGYFMSIAMRLVIWITPTFFLASEAKGLLALIVWYNPFTYFVEFFHDILYYGMVPELKYIVMCVVLAAAFLLIGASVFFHYEKKLPEVL